MSKFNQAEFEEKAKQLVVDRMGNWATKDYVYVAWLSRLDHNITAMLGNNFDGRLFEVTYYGDEGLYVLAGYDLAEWHQYHEEEL
jgi:hypothetical protein